MGSNPFRGPTILDEDSSGYQPIDASAILAGWIYKFCHSRCHSLKYYNGLTFTNGADDVTFTGTGDTIAINNGGTTVNPRRSVGGRHGICAVKEIRNALPAPRHIVVLSVHAVCSATVLCFPKDDKPAKQRRIRTSRPQVVTGVPFGRSPRRHGPSGCLLAANQLIAPPPKCRRNHARALTQSRRTVFSVTPSSAAVSSLL